MRTSSKITAAILLAGLIAVPSLIAQTPATKPAVKPAAPAPRPAAAPKPAGPSLDPIFPGIDAAPWQAAGDYTIEKDPATGAPVLTAVGKRLTLTSTKAYRENSVIQGWLRVPTTETRPGTAEVSIGIKNPADPKEKPTGLVFLGNPAQNAVMITSRLLGSTTYSDDAVRNQSKDWETRNPTSMLYKLRAYNQIFPGWPEEFRNRVVLDMSTLPSLNDKWLNFRIQTTPGRIEMWVDDRLIGSRSDSQIMLDGFPRISLAPGAQLMGVTVSKYAPAAQYLPVPIAGYANALEFADGQGVDWSAMPTDGKPLAGVPFTLSGKNPEGNDHIDIGKSFLRQGNQSGYLPTTGPRLGGADQRDPARIQMRIPFGNYKALHLIAASDGAADSIPVVTAQFYRPGAGFHVNFEGTVPLATATGAADAKPFATKLVNGKAINLYHVTIPLDPGQLSAFSDLDTIEVELTKKVQLFRSYPDPISYGVHPAGLPSGVHVYALTLESTPVDFAFNPDSFGHVWTSDQTPGYTATLVNNSDSPRTGQLTLTAVSYDKTQTKTSIAKVSLPAKGQATKVSIPIPVALYGYHDVKATLTLDATGDLSAYTWTENRSLVKLAPDTRSPRWTEGKGALFGYWSYNGGHYTPKAENILRLMVLAGARTGIGSIRKAAENPAANDLINKHLSPTQAGAWEVTIQPWTAPDAPQSIAPQTPGKPVLITPDAVALKVPLDPEKVKTFQDETIAKFKKFRENIDPRLMPEEVYFFPEPHVSSRLTAGNIPDYWNEKPFELTPDEQKRLTAFFQTSKIVAEAVRKEMPNLKIMIPWGDPGFVWPLLRAGFPKELIDGSGIDIPGFERMPERQMHEQSIHRLYYLTQEYKKAGIPNPRLQFCEGIFVPTEPGAVTWREQMDIYHRTSLLAMAYGVNRFYSSWFAFDCASYYGAEHYGGCGIQRRIPYCDPKPAYAAFATMTQQLDGANFDGWIQTNSLSCYGLRFKKSDGSFVHAFWTLRGKRDVSFATRHPYSIVDSMGNPVPLKRPNGTQLDGTPMPDTGGSFTCDQSVIYLTFKEGAIGGVTFKEPDNSDSVQPADAKPLADLADGSWKFTNERDLTLENNHWAVMHYPGKFEATIESDGKHGKVLQSKLLKQDTVHQLMPWYNILKPAKPIAIPGAPSHLGLWVKGNSDWGRFIYVLKDANGQVFHSIGFKDQYNCDDVHSWSQFNFDGWRYLTFELPGNEGYDLYRKNGSTWWRYSGDGNVALPLSLDSIIVEQRTHLMYVNDIQPAASDTVQFGKLSVLYANPADAAPEAVRLSQLRMPMPKGEIKLSNPIAEMEKTGIGAPTKITKLVEPSHYYDGTRMHFHFDPVEDAAKYYLYCSPYADGSGAVNMNINGIKPGQLVTGFRPGIPLYFWIVWESKDKKLSKPSPVHKEVLVDNFKEK